MYSKEKIQEGIELFNTRGYVSDDLAEQLYFLVDKAIIYYAQKKGLNFEIDDLRQACVEKCLKIIRQGKVDANHNASSYLYATAVRAGMDYFRELSNSARVLSRLYREVEYMLSDDSNNECFNLDNDD